MQRNGKVRSCCILMNTRFALVALPRICGFLYAYVFDISNQSFELEVNPDFFFSIILFLAMASFASHGMMLVIGCQQWSLASIALKVCQMTLHTYLYQKPPHSFSHPNPSPEPLQYTRLGSPSVTQSIVDICQRGWLLMVVSPCWLQTKQ